MSSMAWPFREGGDRLPKIPPDLLAPVRVRVLRGFRAKIGGKRCRPLKPGEVIFLAKYLAVEAIHLRRAEYVR